jgi:hypothetical protein
VKIGAARIRETRRGSQTRDPVIPRRALRPPGECRCEAGKYRFGRVRGAVQTPAMTTRTNKGTWAFRLLIHAFTILFSLLIYWLLGFVMRDIGTWPGPRYEEVEKRLGNAQLAGEADTLRMQIDDTTRAIVSRRQRQTVLRDSTSNSEKTMNQLLEIQRLTIQKGVAPSAEDARALAESQRLFLANQARYQEMNDQIAGLDEQLGGLQDRQREVQKKLEAQRPAIAAEFNRLHARHQFGIASVKLAVLLPLILLAGWLFLRKRAGLYAPLLHGAGLALLVKVGMVIHEHFPTRYFKYILTIAAIVVVTRILVYLLRSVAAPKLEWLLKQYREAYEHFFCPVCSHPIRRGPRKDLFWTRGSLKRLQVPVPTGADAEEPYTCPVCATPLFEACPACRHMRHSLLPACQHCGAEKEFAPPPTASAKT